MVATDVSLSPHADTPLTTLVQLGFTPTDQNAHGMFYYSRRQLVAWTGASAAVTALAVVLAAMPYM